VGEETKDINKEETEIKENDKVDHKKNNESQASRRDKKIMEPQPQEKKGEVKLYVHKFPYPQATQRDEGSTIS